MYCNNCGSRIDIDSRYCKKCGYDYKKEKRKEKQSKRIKNFISKLKKHKKIITKIVLSIFIVFIIIFTIYNKNETVKYKKYLKKENYICHKNKCTKKEKYYNIEIEFKNKRIIYKVKKINEEITLNYAGKDLGNFEITDSLSKFACPYINGEIVEEACIDNLKKAGYEKYKTKMENMITNIEKMTKKN